MFRKRAMTALGLIAGISGALLYLPAAGFQWIVLLAVLLALGEFNRLALSRLRFYRVIALIGGIAVAVTQTWRPAWLPLDFVLILVLFGVAVLYLWRVPVLEGYVEQLAVALLGSLYIGTTLPYLGLLRLRPHGEALVVLTLSMVALSDTAAYTAGRLWGRRKLAPLTSPNKTWEGFYANFLGSIAALLGTRALLWPDLPLLPGIGLALIIGVVAPLGDLIESAVKRASHVKDSGSMLPGHGGVLDRCDAYLFSAPVVYYYTRWIF